MRDGCGRSRCVSAGVITSINHSAPQAAINLLAEQKLEQWGGPLLKIDQQAPLVSAEASEPQGDFSQQTLKVKLKSFLSLNKFVTFTF